MKNLSWKIGTTKTEITKTGIYIKNKGIFVKPVWGKLKGIFSKTWTCKM